MRIAEMDHIVLNVGDIDRSLHFYGDVLGLATERVEEFRAGEIGFPSVRVNRDTIIDLSPPNRHAYVAGTEHGQNLNHFCLVIDDENMDAVIAYLREQGVAVDRPPTHAWGARGRGTSIRIYDPDNNIIEIRTYAPFVEPDAIAPAAARV